MARARCNGQLSWSHAGNTAGFGHAINDGRPFWIGDFTGNGATDVLFYYPGDDNWWLGTFVNGRLTWTTPATPPASGTRINDGRPFWTGDFTGNGSTDVLFYYPGDDNWWLGTMSGGSLTWALAGNSGNVGFGPLPTGSPVWTGDFNANGLDDVLVYRPVDNTWWLGTFAGGSLSWTLSANLVPTAPIWPGGAFWSGYFRGVARADLLFYQPLDANWWLGTSRDPLSGGIFSGVRGSPTTTACVCT